MIFLSLAVPSPLRKPFDYLPPLGMSETEAEKLLPGIRVKAVFGRRSIIAVLLAIKTESGIDHSKLKRVDSIIDDLPLLTTEIQKLCNWSAKYYQHAIGDVFQHAFPKSLRMGAASQLSAESAWELTPAGQYLPEGALKKAPKQTELLYLLQGQLQVDRSQLKNLNISTSTAKILVDKGLLAKTRKSVSCFSVPLAKPGLALNAEQQIAVDQITSHLGNYKSLLLEGITGSGKTEVYLQSIAACLKKGLQALVLIPEIGLTPQTLDRFNQRFGTSVAVFNSNLSAGERARAWEAARCGEAAIVLGTRSAVFTPLKNPGLIIIDEEHDASYKQQEGFRYNARDVAIKRAQTEVVPIVLGSATPSLETLQNADTGRFTHLRLQHRAGIAVPPIFRTLDIRRIPLDSGFSQELIIAIQTHLSSNNQVLIFINRRGYAPTLQCHDCGWIADCPNCDSRLTVHQDSQLLRCHYCDFRQRLAPNCPSCKGSKLIFKGLGTQRCAEALGQFFPHIPVFRIDRDTTQRKGAMADLVDKIHSSGPCLLVGTQMLAKGHHFPNVTLVAILDADAGLFNSDFRSEEKMGQLLTQVAGRAGRASKAGEVLIQTHYPQHPLLTTLISEGYSAYARKLLAERSVAHLPPCGHLILVRADHKNLEIAEAFLQKLRTLLNNEVDPKQVQLFGPLPSPKSKRGNNYHVQLLLSSSARKPLREAAEKLIAAADQMSGRAKPRWSIDIDPQDMI
jgi:primosomal protein N' (replication factor Y)